MNALSVIGTDRRASVRTVEVLDPSDCATVGTVAAATVEDCLDAVDAAAGALAAWSARPPRERAELLRAAWQAMMDRRDEIAELIVRENGKTLGDALAEVGYAAEFFRWYAEEAVRVGGEVRTAPGGDKRIMTFKQPIGVSLLITPWNFPAAMATRKIAPALAAGCTVVVKPATETPLSVYLVADLLTEIGVPPGVVNVVCPQPTGAGVTAMLRHPAVRALSFTGSTEVGALLLEQAAPSIMRCAMELGGNAPFVVFDDADVETAVEGAVLAKMRNGGASCIAANRFYVQAPVAERFTAALGRSMGEFAVGPGLDPATRLGPLVSDSERRRVAGAVDAAVAAGARLEVGGTVPPGPGWFYPATVLGDVSPDAPIVSEEIFGPVAPVVVFERDDEVIELANASEHGLAAYVYSGDLARAMRAAEAIESGMVAVNRGFMSDPAAPFGGVKRSGLGREGGREGVEEFLETKYVAVDWGPGR
jgi:succinate-semialdehyde dehydrogenase/glutarate-semialdehyde dehydrogenase